MTNTRPNFGANLKYKPASIAQLNALRDALGLANVDNTSDADKPVSISQLAALNEKEDKANKNQPNGYAGLDSLGKINNAILPKYLSDLPQNPPPLQGAYLIVDGGWSKFEGGNF